MVFTAFVGPALITALAGVPIGLAIALLVVALLALLMFVLSLVAPKSSRGAQKRIDRWFVDAFRKAAKLPGPWKRATRSSVKASRKTVDGSARKGRKTRGKARR